MSELKAGRELDALVAEKVMGWRRIPLAEVPMSWRNSPHHDVNRWWQTPWEQELEADGKVPAYTSKWATYERDLPCYSTDISAAWEVVERMRGVIGWAIPFSRDDDDDLLLLDAAGAAHAICLAALKAVGAEV